MNNGCMVVFDDLNEIVQTFRSLSDSLGTNLQVVGASTPAEYRKCVNDEDIKLRLRALIIDLAANEKEKENFEIAKDIEENYHTLRVPIFIHSAHLDHYQDFTKGGTVFKFEKGAKSAEQIMEIIKLMVDSGFLEIFCTGGRIENKIMRELHHAFTDQFRGDEILQIIKTVKPEPSDTYVERVAAIFERTSLRSLLQSLISAKNEAEPTIVNPVEHYYRRISFGRYPFWTGDIFANKDKSRAVYVLNPRCDLAGGGCDKVLVCNVSEDFPPDKKRVERAITNNPILSGSKYRYLPPTPLFSGGKVDLSDIFIIDSKDLAENYQYLVSLSDELANEISGKFGAYFLRTGIQEINLDEQMAFLKMKS